MGSRVDQLRRKVQARRKKFSNGVVKKERPQPQYYPSHSEFRDESDIYFPNNDRGGENAEESFFRKDIFMLQLFASICLFLLVGLLFKSQLPQLEGARQLVKSSYENEFQFALVANWYEDRFGKPLALLPTTRNVALEEMEPEDITITYAVPATGKVAKSFAEDGKGVMIETASNASVEAAKGGMVRFVAEEENLGKTVIITHYDGGEAWYAMLNDVVVKLYDHLEAGTKIGTASSREDKGYYYFALKEGETFINPLEVITFD